MEGFGSGVQRKSEFCGRVLRAGFREIKEFKEFREGFGRTWNGVQRKKKTIAL